MEQIKRFCSEPFKDAGAELAELQCHQHSWGVPRVGEPSPTLSLSQGKHWFVISWKCKGSSEHLRSSRAPNPGGAPVPELLSWAPHPGCGKSNPKVWKGQSQGVERASWVWKGQFQAVPSSADGPGGMLPWHNAGSQGLLKSIQQTGGSAQEKKSHQLRRKMTFGERQGIAAARVVKSPDKIFNTEEQETLANC